MLASESKLTAFFLSFFLLGCRPSLIGWNRYSGGGHRYWLFFLSFKGSKFNTIDLKLQRCPGSTTQTISDVNQWRKGTAGGPARFAKVRLALLGSVDLGVGQKRPKTRFAWLTLTMSGYVWTSLFYSFSVVNQPFATTSLSWLGANGTKLIKIDHPEVRWS